MVSKINLEDSFKTEINTSKLTYMASRKSLAKNWNSKEEDKAWAHLQKVK